MPTSLLWKTAVWFAGQVASAPTVNPPEFTSALSIAFSGTLDAEITPTGGAYTGDEPITVTWQWLLNGAEIDGETNETYAPGINESGNYLSVEKTLTNAFDTSVSVTSNSVYIGFIRDSFTTLANAGFASPLAGAPGPGKLVRVADSADNVSIPEASVLRVAAAAGDLDPAYIWTLDDGNPVTRAANRALVLYNTGTAWAGWTDDAALNAVTDLIYGMKERSAVDAGVEKVWALPIGDPAHVMILQSTGAYHVARIGAQEYLCWTYPAGSGASLYPAILGSVCDYNDLLIYDVTPPTPTATVTTPAQDDTFTHPINQGWILEIPITVRATGADTRIDLAWADTDNCLRLYITAGGALNLYRRVAATNTIEKSIFANGVCADGTRLVIQWTAPAPLVDNSGNNFKVWCGTSYYGSTLGATAATMLATYGAAVVAVKPAGTTLGTIKTWAINL